MDGSPGRKKNKKQKTLFIVFANFRDKNTPTMADFKLSI